MLLTFAIFERAKNHGQKFLKLCQISFSGIVHSSSPIMCIALTVNLILGAVHYWPKLIGHYVKKIQTIENHKNALLLKVLKLFDKGIDEILRSEIGYVSCIAVIILCI